MARTIKEIQTQIITEKEKYPELDSLSVKDRSVTSIWGIFIYIFSYIISTLETLFDFHKQEVDHIISELKPHTPRWYRNKTVAFQYGFDLLEDSDKFNNKGYSREEIENSKIVKYAAVVESEDFRRLIIKIAGEKNGELQPISQDEKETLEAYINEIKDAGVPITITNYLPDILSLDIKIKRDPLVLDKSGNAISPINGIIKPIDVVILNFLRNLPFNGELVLSHLVDRLQETHGVLDVKLINAESKSVNMEEFIGIDMSVVPHSGYFTLKEDTLKNIKYEV